MAARLQAGMHIDGVLILPPQRQTVKKCPVLGGDLGINFLATGCRVQPIARQGLQTADLQEDRTIPSAQVLAEEKVMVAHQGDGAVCFLPL